MCIRDSGVDIRLLDEEIHMLRICKDEEEQRLMQEAVDITDDIYQRVIHHLHIGMSEYEISASVSYTHLMRCWYTALSRSISISITMN